MKILVKRDKIQHTLVNVNILNDSISSSEIQIWVLKCSWVLKWFEYNGSPGEGIPYASVQSPPICFGLPPRTGKSALQLQQHYHSALRDG